jgi:undecaprenyl-diphosphatase
MFAVLLAVCFCLDATVAGALARLRRSPFADFLENSVRWLGTGYVQVAVLLVLAGASAALRLPTLRPAAWSLLAFSLSGLAAILLKVLVHRPRPWTQAAPDGWSDYLSNSSFHSFPSGESTTSFALAVVLGAWFPKLRVPLMAAAALIAVARVLVGSHYPSDVMGGAMLGILVGQMVNHLSRRKKQQLIPRKREQGA